MAAQQKSAGCTGLYRKGRRSVAPLRSKRGRQGQLERRMNYSPGMNHYINRGLASPRGSGPSHDTSHTPSTFAGYQPGMSLRDAEPTRMNSDSSNDSSDILDDDPDFDHHGNHQGVLGSEGLGVAPRSPQPYQSTSHRSNDRNLIALLQSQQASLEKVSVLHVPV